MSTKSGQPTSPRRNSVSGPPTEDAKTRPTSQTMRAAPAAEPAKPVSQETLDELQKMNDRRTNIVREIYETEKSYVRNLKEICDVYIGPLKVLTFLFACFCCVLTKNAPRNRNGKIMFQSCFPTFI